MNNIKFSLFFSNSKTLFFFPINYYKIIDMIEIFYFYCNYNYNEALLKLKLIIALLTKKFKEKTLNFFLIF